MLINLKLILLCTIFTFTNINIALFLPTTFNPSKQIYSVVDTISDEISWPKDPDVVAESAILMEASTGTILYEKNIHEKRYPASITKIMTSLVTIENSNLDELVTYSKNAIYGIERDSSHIWLDIGETITMEQSLYAILLESANEASYGVAEHVAGDLSSFTQMMNERAKQIGCLNTNFVNANGLHDDDHYTTAYDMALISRVALMNNTFKKITSTLSYQIPPTNKQSETRYLVNHHKMLLTYKYAGAKPYEGCEGGKTGYTQMARNTLVTFAKKGNVELIVVVLKTDKINQWEDTKKLLDFGFDNFSVYNIANEESINFMEGSLLVSQSDFDFDNNSPTLHLNTLGNVVLPNSAEFNDCEKLIQLNTDNVISNNVIGSMVYTYQGKEVGSTTIEYYPPKRLFESNAIISSSYELSEEIAALNQLDNPSNNTGTKSKINLKPIIIGCIIAVLVILYTIYYVIVEIPRLKRKKNYYLRRRKAKEGFSSRYFD